MERTAGIRRKYADVEYKAPECVSTLLKSVEGHEPAFH